MELRELKAQDLGIVCKIISGIGLKEFKPVLEQLDFKSLIKKQGKLTEVDFVQIGVPVAIEVVGIIMEHIPDVQKDVDTFLASLTGSTIADIRNMDFADYGELIFDVVTKEEFKDFFKRAVKLFSR